MSQNGRTPGRTSISAIFAFGDRNRKNIGCCFGVGRVTKQNGIQGSGPRMGESGFGITPISDHAATMKNEGVVSASQSVSQLAAHMGWHQPQADRQARLHLHFDDGLSLVL
ncbi:hypothetical protein SCOR_14935 [Sulfidibacter corallicola]